MTDTQRMVKKELRLADMAIRNCPGALPSLDTIKSYCRKNNLAGVMAGKPSSSADGKTFCKKCGKELLQKPNQKTLLFCSNDAGRSGEYSPRDGKQKGYLFLPLSSLQ